MRCDARSRSCASFSRAWRRRKRVPQAILTARLLTLVCVVERVWQKHKTSGDLDDNALVDGVAGDRNIYKFGARYYWPKKKNADSYRRYRGEEKPEPGAVQEKPKRLRFVIDLSGLLILPFFF